MKLENKRKAQEKRAKERARKELQIKILRVIMWILVIAVVVAILLAIGLGVYHKISDKPAATTTTEANTAASEEDLNYNTTAGIAVNEGDKINLDYTGYVDDVAFDRGSTNGNGTDMVVGSAGYIPGFEDQIIGHVTGETFDIFVTFPDDYSNSKELAGKEAKFTITINGIYE